MPKAARTQRHNGGATAAPAVPGKSRSKSVSRKGGSSKAPVRERSKVAAGGGEQRAGSAAGAAAGGGGASKASKQPTPFQSRVYDLAKAIPAGRVTTYGAMAEALGSAPRAVGQALRCNPFAPVVPCHRIIAADLQLGGFSGAWGAATPQVQRKRALLAEEGVAFDEAGRLREPSCVMGAPELRSAAGARRGRVEQLRLQVLA